jgi:hypothetical protein
MDIDALLLGLAEVSIAFAGFSGVVAALGRRVQWTDVERYRFTNLVTISTGAALFSFLPMVVSLYEIAAALRWSLSGVLLAVFVVGFLVNRVRVGAKIARTPGQVSVWVSWVFMLSLLIIAVLQAIGLAVHHLADALYVTSLLILLMLAAVQFVVFVLRSIASET